MAPHAVRSYYNTEAARRRRSSATPPRFVADYGIECYGNPIGKEAFFKSMGLRMKRVRYDKFFEEEEVSPKRRKSDIPAGICLRECSVVIQGVLCKICRREFKCRTDLATHMKSRHIIVEDSFGNDIYCDLSSETDTDASRINDSSSPTLGDPKIRHKKGKKRLSRMRLVFKLGTEIMGDLFIKRKHLKRGVISESTETCESPDSEENYEHISQNAALFISQNKYITANVRAGQVIQTGVTDRVSISHTNCKSVSQNESAYTNCRVEPVNNGSFPDQNIHRGHPCSIIPPSACAITRVDNSAVVNNSCEPGKNPTSVSNAAKDVFSAHNKSEVPTCTNSLPKHSIHRNLPRPVVTVTQSVTPVKTSTTNSTSQANPNDLSITCVYNSPNDALSNSNNLAISSKNTSLPNNSNEFVKEILQNGNTEIRPNVFVRPVLEAREQGKERLRHLNNEASPLTTIENLSSVSGYNTKSHETTKPASNEDDIQEILRINRGKIMPGPIEINHESPNRADREILQVVDAISDMIRMEAQGLHLLGGKEYTDEMNMKNLRQGNVSHGPFGDVNIPNIHRTESHEAHSCQFETRKKKVPTKPYKNSSEEFQHYGCNCTSASPEIRCGNNMTPRYTQHSHSRREPESKGNRAVILIDLVDD